MKSARWNLPVGRPVVVLVVGGMLDWIEVERPRIGRR
jgi:hypothetical protein